jgi:hypothetical protein
MPVRRLSDRFAISRMFAWFLPASAAIVFAAVLAAGDSPTAPATAKAQGNAVKLQGVLLDKECSPKAETRLVSEPSPHLEGGMLWAYTHTRSCALMPACQRSGYGVLTFETNKYITFDAAGNLKAIQLLRSATKADDLRVEVTGQLQGDTIKVASIRLL